VKKQRKLGVLIIGALFLFLALSFLTMQVGRVKADQGPVASFVYTPSMPTPGDSILFDASSSYDSVGTIVTYAWDFGDGYAAVVTSPTIAHSYPIDGTYTVQLIITDDTGLMSTATAVVQVNCVVFFRVSQIYTLTPMSNVQVTAYTNSSGTWTKAPMSSSAFEIRYDNTTQPNLAKNSPQKYHNPGYTASILLCNASNIGFELHPSNWYAYFSFSWNGWTAQWPNETAHYYTYENGKVKTHNYKSGHGPVWNAAAGAYVMKVQDIVCLSAEQDEPIIVTLSCPVPPPQYYLTVKTSPTGVTTIPGQGLYGNGTNAVLTAPTYVNISSNTRYRFINWDVDGTSQGAANPITVTMNANHTATAHYVLQYLVTWAQTGLSSAATGTVATINGSANGYPNLPYTLWVDNGGSATYSYNSIVTSSITGQQFRLASVSGPSAPITVTGPVTVTGNYVTQYLVTFAQTGLDSTATGTIVTVNGTAKTYLALPYSYWVDSGSIVSYSYSSIVSSSSAAKRFRLGSTSGASSPITVAVPTTVTGNYVVQYQITFAQTGLDSSATGTVVTVNGNPKGYADLPFTLWADSGSSVTYSYGNISSSTVGKRLILTSVAGSSSPLSVTGPMTVTGNYKTQYSVTFDQSGVGVDFAGTVVTVDSVNYNAAGLPVQFWWDQSSGHSFAFASPLTVNASKQYVWGSTSGLSSLQSGSLTISASGSVTGTYTVQNTVTFDQTGVSSDFSGTVVIIDGNPYGFSTLPVSFYWSIGSMHSFAFQSPLVVTSNGKQYVWTSTTGLSSVQSGSFTVSVFGSIVGNYKTQYYLTLATSPPSVASPSSAGWYDAGTGAPISTPTLVDIVPGSSHYRFNNWTTADMTEIANSSATSTTVLMDKSKTLTANYVIQYQITFSQTGVGNDFTGTIVTIDGTPYNYGALPASFWFDNGSSHTFSFASPLAVNASTEYDWSSTSGLATTQSGTLTVTGSGSVTGHYAVQIKIQITFDPGVGTDFTGTVLVIDGVNYTEIQLPVSFLWTVGSNHTFAYQSPLVVAPNVKQYVWTSTTGLSTSQSGSITATISGSIIGYYKTQYYLALATSPSGTNSPTGAGWYDVGTNATISTDAFVDIVPGSSRYRFNGWTTGNMSEISDPTRSPTNVSMDAGKTVTANYVVQYKVTFDQTGVGSDFNDTIVTIDLVNFNWTQLPVAFWLDNATSHNFAFQSPLVVTANGKQYVWTSTSGLSAAQSDTLLVSGSGTVLGNYKTQYYFSSSSPHNSPTPANGWFDNGASITASVASSVPGPTGTQYVCTGWTGTGSVPSSGLGSSVTFTIAQATSMTWNWKTQYFLMITTDPGGITSISGSGWYDASASVPITAPSVPGSPFDHWDVDGISQGAGVSSITVTMDAAHTATAHYLGVSPPPLSPVGGFSISLAKLPPMSYFGAYAGLIVAFALTLTLRKRRRK